MRIVAPLLLMANTWFTSPSRAEEVFGVWKTNLIRSTNAKPQGLVVRFEQHPKGEVFTQDRTEGDGRSTTSSTILYLDGKAREFEDFGCSGTQSSRRSDNQTVEILRACGPGEWTRFVRRLSKDPKELVLEITEQQSDGRRFERRLVLEKQEVNRQGEEK